MKRLTPALTRQTAEAFNRAHPLPGNIHFRAALADDLDAVMEVGCKCFDYDQPERPKIRHFLTKAHAAIVLLCDGDKPIGYLHVEGHAGRQSIYFNTTALLDTYRGKGLGNLLYVFADDLARDAKAKSIWCHVALDNDLTFHLLKKNGYVVERIEDPYYHDDGRGAYIMRKPVSAA